MTSKLVRHFWIVILVLLVACGKPVGRVSPTTMSISTFTATSTPSPMPVSPTPLVTSTSNSLPVSSAPDGLHMAYIINGNLYFQQGSKPALQLTSSGKDSLIFFSEDGEKIYFRRGANPPFDLYSINIDGSSEQILVTNDLLRAVDTYYEESTGVHSVTIIPNTPLLLFGTMDFQSNAPRWNNDLLSVDAETVEIKRLLPLGQARSFDVSPDCKFIAIDARGEIDILDVEGEFIHQNIVTYTPSEPTFLAPGISWMPDSKRLVVTLPVPTVYETSASGPSYTVWHYTLDENKGVQVPLEILPTENDKATVSPDGNWILYYNTLQNAFYVGDLRSGHTEPYEQQGYVLHYRWGWSPDSKHFIYAVTAGQKLYLGTVNNLPELIGNGDFLGWIDSNRYIYYADKNIVLGNIDGTKEIIINDQESFIYQSNFTFILSERPNR